MKVAADGAARRDLSRLLKPSSIAVIGGGAWCAGIIGAARRIGYCGDIIPVHPRADAIAGIPALRRIEDRDGPIDSAFVGINREATITAVATLRRLGAGGAVCFASGFAEARSQIGDGDTLQARLIEAAGEMPILGPNCYGFVNALDRAAIWPDQHGMQPVDRGVAILTQSSNIAINLTMQRRALPLAFMVTCGNMAQTGQAEIAAALLEDERITAIGLHVEGFGDLRCWESLAARAHSRGVPLVALKAGASEQARAATVSHTASLAGSDAGAQAILDRLGIARLNSLPAFLETLKLLHVTGPLPSARIASISCSGGEASLIADMAAGRSVDFPPLGSTQVTRLQAALGPKVALANPLDYHTYIWRDTDVMTRTWQAMAQCDVAITLSIVDYPHTDARDWVCATDAALNARARSGRPFAVAATLPELMPLEVAARLMDGDVVPLMGLDEALCAIEAAAAIRPPVDLPLCLVGMARPGAMIDEAGAKARLAGHGLKVPRGMSVKVEDIQYLDLKLTPPFAVKGIGLAHKTDRGAVHLNVAAGELARVATSIGTPCVLIEEMCTGGVAELLVGVVRDPAHGFVLTLGAGGVLTELANDTVSLMIPSERAQIAAALGRLRCAPLLSGYRGRPAADPEAILDAIEAIQSLVLADPNAIYEVEVNPLICSPDRAVAVDALIREAIR